MGNQQSLPEASLPSLKCKPDRQSENYLARLTGEWEGHSSRASSSYPLAQAVKTMHLWDDVLVTREILCIGCSLDSMPCLQEAQGRYQWPRFRDGHSGSLFTITATWPKKSQDARKHKTVSAGECSSTEWYLSFFATNVKPPSSACTLALRTLKDRAFNTYEHWCLLPRWYSMLYPPASLFCFYLPICILKSERLTS